MCDDDDDDSGPGSRPWNLSRILNVFFFLFFLLLLGRKRYIQFEQDCLPHQPGESTLDIGSDIYGGTTDTIL